MVTKSTEPLVKNPFYQNKQMIYLGAMLLHNTQHIYTMSPIQDLSSVLALIHVQTYACLSLIGQQEETAIFINMHIVTLTCRKNVQVRSSTNILESAQHPTMTSAEDIHSHFISERRLLSFPNR